LNDRVELSLVSMESSFVTFSSSFTGVKRFPLHPMVNYEYFMLCLKNLSFNGFSQGIWTSKISGAMTFCPSVQFSWMDLPSVSWWMARNWDMCTILNHLS